jgi:transposase
MSERRLKQMDIREIIRHIREGRSDRQIGKDLGVDRRTVKRYRGWAEAQGLLSGELPDHENLRKTLDVTMPEKVPPQNSSKADPYRMRIQELLGEKAKVTAIYDRLKEQGYSGSYASVLRLARQIEPKTVETYVRKECQPGEEAEIDFGYVGMLQDGEGNLRKAWAFVMVLGWSRYAVRGVRLRPEGRDLAALPPQRADVLWRGAAAGGDRQPEKRDHPGGVGRSQVQQAYRECAEHYGFLILPCRPAHPGTQRQGGRAGCTMCKDASWVAASPTSLVTQANRDVRLWCKRKPGCASTARPKSSRAASSRKRRKSV